MRLSIKSNAFCSPRYWLPTLLIYIISTLNVDGQIIPSQVGGLSLWFRSDTLVTADGSNKVSFWGDLSGNNANASNLTVSQQPLLIDSGLGAYPVIKFDGFDDFMALDSTTTVSDLTFISVIRPDDLTSEGILGGEATSFFALLTPTQVRWSRSGPAYTLNHSGIYTIGDFQIITTYIEGTSYNISKNKDVYPATATPGYPPQNISEIGRVAAGNGRFNGAFIELILFDSRIPDSMRFEIEDYLIDRYSPPVDLPDTIFNTKLCADTTISAGSTYRSYIWSTGDTTADLFITQAGTYSVTVESSLGIISSDSVVITGPKIDLPPDTVLCLGDSLLLSGDLGSQYSYLWSNGETSSIIKATNEFIYNLQVSDTLGCTIYSDSINVGIDSFPALNLLPSDTFVCENQQIKTYVDDSLIATYNWMGLGSNAAYIVATAGDYWVELENIRGCVSNDTASVSIKGKSPVASFDVDTTCFGDTTYFTDLSSVVNGNIESWMWLFGDGGYDTIQHPFYIYSVNTTYSPTLIVTTDSGCSANVSGTVFLRDPPVAGFSQGIICAGTETTFTNLSFPANDDSIAGWLWTIDTLFMSNDFNATVTFPEAGDYPVELKIISEKGCISKVSDSVEIFDELIPNFIVTNNCSGELVEFTDSSISNSIVAYLWDFGDGIGTSSLANPIYFYSSPGDYEVRLTVTNAIGCVNGISDSITINTLPLADFDNATLCEDAPGILTDLSIPGSDSIVYWIWRVDGDSVCNLPDCPYVFTDSGMHSVALEIITESGCHDYIEKDILVEPKPSAGFEMDPQFGTAPLLVKFKNSSKNAVSYLWKFGEEDSIYTFFEGSHLFDQNGEYDIFLIAVNNSNCRDTAIKTLTLSDLVADLEIVQVDYELLSDNSYEISAIFANKGQQLIASSDFILQMDNGLKMKESWDGILYPGLTGVFSFNVILLAADGNPPSTICVEASNVNNGTEFITSNNRNCILLDKDVVLHRLYPNPSDDYIVLDIVGNRLQNWNITVFNSLGNRMRYDQLESGIGLTSLIIETTTFASGIYFISADNGERRYTQKFQISRE